MSLRKIKLEEARKSKRWTFDQDHGLVFLLTDGSLASLECDCGGASFTVAGDQMPPNTVLVTLTCNKCKRSSVLGFTSSS